MNRRKQRGEEIEREEKKEKSQKSPTFSKEKKSKGTLFFFSIVELENSPLHRDGLTRSQDSPPLSYYYCFGLDR